MQSSSEQGRNMLYDNVSRRSFLKLSGATAAVAGLGLAACGNSGSTGSTKDGTTATDTGTEPQNGSPATTSPDQLPLPEKGKVYTNPKDRSEMKQGGTVVIPAGEVGPNWNYYSTEGNTVEMHTYWMYYMPDIVLADATLTKFTPDPNFITNISSSTDSGKLVVTVDFNEKAQFNDGTPIDYRALAAVWTVMNGKSDKYMPAATDGYDKIESVERGSSDKQAVITFSEPVYPYEPIVSQILHPDGTDPEKYLSWNNNPHAEWGYGPFPVDSVDETQVTFVPNPNWWGEAPMVDSVQYKQMDSQALFNAFKNGEVDCTGTAASGSAEMLSNFTSMDDATVRRADSLSVACIEINTARGVLSDIAVRKAFCQSCDPSTIRAVVWQGVNWDEETPGSLLVPSWADGYENNMPDDVYSLKSDERTSAAKKTLEDAGYTMGDDGFYAKDGTKVSFSFTTFGDSNTVKNRAAAIQTMAKNAGIDVEIDAKPASAFSTTLASGNWDICLFGWSSSTTYVWNAPQIYGSTSSSNFTQYGTAELDAELAKIVSIEDPTEQKKALNEAEKKALESYAFLPLFSGPDVIVTKATLANFGPALFETFEAKNLGWEA